MLQAYDKEGRKIPYAIEKDDYVLDIVPYKLFIITNIYPLEWISMDFDNLDDAYKAASDEYPWIIAFDFHDHIKYNASADSFEIWEIYKKNSVELINEDLKNCIRS